MGWDRGSRINQLTPHPFWAYCKIPGDIGVRIKKEGGETVLFCVPDVAFRAASGSQPLRRASKLR